MDLCLQQRQIPPAVLDACLSELAGKLRSFLAERGAMFSGDLARSFAVPVAELQRALWELVAAGLVTADGFDSLRMLIDPRRTEWLWGACIRKARGKVGHAAGRWSLLCGDALATSPAQREAQLESACTVLLRRYGVVFRDLLAREETMPRWRELLGIFRRMEARGEVRGGRFLSGFGGEQFALPEAVESLREMRRRPDSSDEVTVAAADPMNLVGYRGSGRAGGCGAGKDGRIRERSRGWWLSSMPARVDAAPLASDEGAFRGCFLRFQTS